MVTEFLFITLWQDLYRLQAARWFVMLLIGILTALVASFIDITVTELSKVKFRLIHRCILFALCTLQLLNCRVYVFVIGVDSGSRCVTRESLAWRNVA